MSSGAPSPFHFFEALQSYQLTAALKAAVELELFTAIGEGARTPEALGTRLKASPKGVRVLCDFLTVTRFLTKDAEGYSLTEDSALFLDKRSPAYLGGATAFLLSDTIMGNFNSLTNIVRHGGTLMSPKGTMETDHPIWIEFARSMVAMMAKPAEFMAQSIGATNGEPLRVLDIAAGHGLFGITIARLNPKAEVVAVDWDKVLDVAYEHAQAAGVAERYHTMRGSAFELDWGTGFDIVLFTNFFHHFEPAVCETLMRKAFHALKPGGRAVTLEFVPNEDRVTPGPAAVFSMTMLATTALGDAYTFSEYDRMFRNAGFERSEYIDMPMGPERIITSHKRS